ncbi:NHL repeat-containing protein [Streptomyces echinatus]|uniref:hypothetical protein n=1 Tax=Streptomyces echinatus TaxID=67293 RepID=UPI0038127AF3
MSFRSRSVSVRGRGLNLPGFGIAIAPDKSIWVANPGDKGTGKSLSQFTSAGKPVPFEWLHPGDLHGPQGLTADKHGNIWVPNWRARSITAYPAGNPAAAKSITAGGIDHPFVIATDPQGGVWINNLRGVTVLTPDGKPTLHRPWGIAVDGNDHVWVADADHRNVTEFCGARPETCPRASDGKPLRTGDPISPTASGWTNKALHVLTGVAVDPVRQRLGRQQLQPQRRRPPADRRTRRCHLRHRLHRNGSARQDSPDRPPTETVSRRLNRPGPELHPGEWVWAQVARSLTNLAVVAARKRCFFDLHIEAENRPSPTGVTTQQAMAAARPLARVRVRHEEIQDADAVAVPRRRRPPENSFTFTEATARASASNSPRGNRPVPWPTSTG